MTNLQQFYLSKFSTVNVSTAKVSVCYMAIVERFVYYYSCVKSGSIITYLKAQIFTKVFKSSADSETLLCVCIVEDWEVHTYKNCNK